MAIFGLVIKMRCMALLNHYHYDCAIIHYAEIGIKGKNRGTFEHKLIQNIRTKLGNSVTSHAFNAGHITVMLDPLSDMDRIDSALKKIPGVAYFSLAYRSSLSVDAISDMVVSHVKPLVYDTFKIDTARHVKTFHLNSIELNQTIGGAVIDAYHKKVKLKDPDLTVKIELAKDSAYISFENKKGVGGLPTDATQKVVALISGGIDSPVASYLMMKRGCEVIFVHVKNDTQMACATEDKMMMLVKQLSQYQIKTRFHIIPFELIQHHIVANVHSSYRMLIYRRVMMKLAAKIAKMYHALFLVVGDSFSQVASQTFHNLHSTYGASDVHVLSPLIGFDKQEIVDISRQIGTFDISSLPYGDCCTYFMPKHPATKSTPQILDAEELKLDLLPMIDDAIKRMTVITL